MTTVAQGSSDGGYSIKNQFPLKVDPSGNLYTAGGGEALADSTQYGTATNATVTITFAAVQGYSHCLKKIGWSYSADPLAGSTPGIVTVAVGGTTVESFDITTGGPGFEPYEPSLMGKPGAAMVVTLSAGGANIVGKLSCTTHYTVYGTNFPSSVSDSMTLGESVNLAMAHQIAVSDSMTLGEAKTVSNLTLGPVSVSDGITLTESAIQIVNVYLVSIADSMTLAEVVGIGNMDRVASVSDSMTLSEALTMLSTMNIGQAGALADGFTLGEAVTVSAS